MEAWCASDFQLEGQWFKSGLCCRVFSLDKKLCFTLPLFTQVYKCVPATYIVLRGNLATD